MSKAIAMALAVGTACVLFAALASAQLPPPADQVSTCVNGAKGEDETDVDCGGGTCGACDDGKRCDSGDDCRSRVCHPENRLICLLLRDCDGSCAAPPSRVGEDTFHYCEDRGRCIMFVTSTTHDGNLGGVSGADRICNTRAGAAGLVGDYQAWLCDGSVGPHDRSHRWNVQYVRTDGALIANGWDDLTDGSLANPIDRDEFGNQVSSFVDSLPWTYVRPDGKCDDATYLSSGSGPCPAFRRCKLNCAADPFGQGWTSSSPSAQGAKGDLNLSNSYWTDGVTGLCSSPTERIYCIEQ